MLDFLLFAAIIPLIVLAITALIITLIVLKVVLRKRYVKKSLTSSQTMNVGMMKLTNGLTTKKQTEEREKDAAKEKSGTCLSIVVPSKKDESSNDKSLKTEQSNSASTTRNPFTSANDKQDKEDQSVKHYTLLAVFQGRLIEDLDKTTYYRSWQERGQIHFEFYCENDVMLKAINNHGPLIDPFCEKEKGSVDYNNAISIVSVKSGILSSDNSISTKAIIKYV